MLQILPVIPGHAGDTKAIALQDSHGQSAADSRPTTCTSRPRMSCCRGSSRSTSRSRCIRASLESIASFFGAQMMAMENATKSAGDMIRRYTLQYNRARQAAITKELAEIVGGAEALKG